MDRTRKEQLNGVAEKLLDNVLRIGIDGVGRLPSAQAAADRALQLSGGDRERAIKHIITVHTRLAATGGFVTGLGGFITMMAALPVNVAEFYILAARMVAAIAAVYGHDLKQPEVRTAVLLSLTGKDATKVLAKAGIGSVTGRLTSVALRPLPPSVLMVVNKAVAFRLLLRVGEKSLTRFGRAIPVIGGVIGGTFDVLFIRQIAKYARAQFDS